MSNLFDRFVQARYSYWRTQDETKTGALFCILQANVRVIPHALQILRCQEADKSPLSLEAWADAIDAAYLAGF